VKKTSIVAMGAMLVGTALVASAPVKAAEVTVGVAAPADECVTYRAHPHKVVARYAYCDQPVWTGDPLVIDGVTYHENLHYRTWHGHREFWIKGRWVRHD